MAKQKSIFKTIGVVFMSLVTVVCIALDLWYLYINKFGESITESTTVIVSDMTVSRTDVMTGETVTDTKCFIEANVYDNVFELKFNQLLDESHTAFYSTGIQLITNDDKTLYDEDIFDGNYSKNLITQPISINKETFKKFAGLSMCRIYESSYNQIVTNKNYYNLKLYEHQSSDDYETPFSGTALQLGDESFKIQVQEGGENEVLRLTFKDYDSTRSFYTETLDVSKMTQVGTSTEFVKSENTVFKINHYYDNYTYYRAYDIYYLIEYIANSVKGLAAGYVGDSYIKMPDMFKVERYNEDSQLYEQVGTNGDETVNLYSETCLYNKIKLSVHSGKMTKSTQSIFNKYGEYQNYNADKTTIDTTDYLTGRSLLVATLDDLEWIPTENSNVYKFALSEEFKHKWESYKKSSFVKIVIDFEKLAAGNITYSGFEINSMGEFTLYQIVKSDGSVLFQGVAYA